MSCGWLLHMSPMKVALYTVWRHCLQQQQVTYTYIALQCHLIIITSSGKNNLTKGRIAAAHERYSLYFTIGRLIHGWLGPPKCTSQQHVGRFSSFCRAHNRDRQTDRPCYSVCSNKKGKGFPYPIPSVGPGADPGVQAVSLQVTVSHPPSGRLPVLSARPAVTSPATEHQCPLAGTKLYCLVTEAHRCEQPA